MPENPLAESWWLMLLRGIVAILFAIFAFTRPVITLASLILVVGVFALVEGTLAAISALRARKSQEDWWVVLIEGLLGIVFGVLVFASPAITTLVLLFYIAAWAIVLGALRIAFAIRLRRHIHGEFWLILSGVVSIAFGLLMMAFPGAGAIAALIYIAVWALIIGVSEVLLAFRLRSLGKHEAPTPGAQAPAH